MMRCSSSVLSRSARIFDEMPSSDLVSNSRKCRRLPNIMSRITSRLHLSPTTSSVRLIGQPERCSLSMSGSRHVVKTPRKNHLHCHISNIRVQPVVKHKQFGEERDVRQGENHPRRLCRLYDERPRGRRRCAGGGFPFHQPL